MKMKITILEDSVIESERLKNGIRKYGQQYDWDIEIDEYESGEEYFSKNSEGTTIQASAFFLDIQMGQMNGIEVAKRLRESGYQGIIVFLTAFREYVFRGYEVRALNYLLKPVKENTLFLCLDEIAKELSNNTYIYRNKHNLLADDYRTYVEIELTKGRRELTEDDEREADALCKRYLERWREELE